MATITIGSAAYWDVRDQIPTGVWPQRTLSAVKSILVHHSDTDPMASMTRPAKLAALQAIYRDHTSDTPRHPAWPGIAYHAAVFPDGDMAIIGGSETVRYHTGGPDTAPRNGIGDANDRGYGVVLMGRYTTGTPPEPMLRALERLIGNVGLGLGADLAVEPHRAYANTACPGAWFEAWLHPEDAPPAPVVDWQAEAVEQLNARWREGEALVTAGQAIKDDVVAAKARLGMG
jgi:hypothetical protein